MTLSILELERAQRMVLRAMSPHVSGHADMLDVDASFSALGMDSLGLTTFCKELNDAHALELRPTIFYEYPTVRSFAEHLVGRYAAQLEAVLTKRTATAGVSATAEAAASISAAARPAELRAAAGRPAAMLRAGGADVLVSLRSRRGNWAGSRTAPAAEPRPAAPVAIVGMSGSFPGAVDLAAFWENLLGEKDSIGEIPPQRWDWRAIYGDPTREVNKTHIKWGGFIEGIDEFDPMFFGISPKEAELMDPQQRLLMMHTWKAVEDAGYSTASLSGSKTGIFVGTAGSGYGDLVARANGPIDGYNATGATPSVGPNRMSYLLNLHGPSEPIETACSSSLVAIHRAVRAMQCGDCDMALVGGINAIVTPWAHISFSKAGMLSEDGRCKTFSKNANGYVRGEGVGILFLKKLDAAERDGDHIYGLIRGSATNHGGRATSLTAPNSQAQAEMIKSAYREARIDPRSVTYVEAHGTGTRLGDPIEINALKSAFASLAGDAALGEDDPQEAARCGIGSVKTNIGHLELAAGVAGVMKVLLQLRHRTLVKTLHCEDVNPYIELADSPFYIVQDTQPWPVRQDKAGASLPRRAGVSSFGFGGVNAHVIIEEYVAPAREAAPRQAPSRPACLVLSAKNDARLRDRVSQLRGFLGTEAASAISLAELAYTLQVGRDAMAHRLAFTATSIADVRAKLGAYLDGRIGRGEFDECHVGDAKANKDLLANFRGDEDIQAAIAAWIEKGRYGKLLQLWSKGWALDWAVLHGERKPRRVALPTYPFARERHWIESKGGPGGVPAGRTTVLHPLLQANTSTLDGLRFSSVLKGDEFYLRDHVINGQRVLPGVAYLEMARAAANFIRGAAWPASVEIKNLVWQRPLVANVEQEVHLGLQSQDDDGVAFKIYTAGPHGRPDRVHAAGWLLPAAQPGGESARQDLAALRAVCTRSIDVDAGYAAFKSMGIEYGPAHRGLTRLQAGTDGQGRVRVLAEVNVPGCVSGGASAYQMHPSVMDGALQAAIGLAFVENETAAGAGTRPMLPFALESLQVFAPTPAAAFVVVMLREGSTQPDVRKLDIDVCDESGRVCVRFSGINSRVLGETTAAASTVLLHSRWESQPVAAPEPDEPAGARQRWVFLDPHFRSHLEELTAAIPAVQWEVLPDRGSDAAGYFAASGEVLLRRVQALLQSAPPQEAAVQLVVAADLPGQDGEFLTAFSGLLMTAALENPRFKGQIISVSGSSTGGELARTVHENGGAAALLDARVRHVGGLREVLRYRPLQAVAAAVPWKDDGVYLVTGGAGGLGLLLTRDIFASVDRARVILVGRSKLAAARAAALEDIRQASPDCTLEYRRLDVTDANATRECVQGIVERFGGLDGVVHGAGIIKDGWIANKSAEEFGAVLGPKVAGLLNLDDATRDLALDFLIVFSSMTAAFGNPGQADYATANAFMDRYTQHRERRVNAGERRGRSLAVNWPLWTHGGMQVDAALAKRMRREGLDTLETAAGFEALYQAWSGAEPVVLVLSGDRARIEERASGSPAGGAAPGASGASAAPGAAAPVGSDAAPAAAAEATAELAVRMQQALIEAISLQLKVKADDIDVDAELSDFGFDSISLIALGHHLDEEYGLDLRPTVFFEHPTIRRFAGHLVNHHFDALQEKLAKRDGRAAAGL